MPSMPTKTVKVSKSIPPPLENTDGVRRSKRIEEKQKQLSGKKRQRPGEDEEETEEEDDDLVLMMPPSAKKVKLNHAENTNNSNSDSITLGDEEVNCEWIGRYGDLDKHLLTCPLEFINCQYFKCGCTEKIRRKDMATHVKKCEYAPINCPKCVIMRISRGYLEKHLLNDCKMAEIECKECGQRMMRKDMLRHKKKECGEFLVECEYRKYGCALIRRKNVKKHMEEFAQHHLKLVKDSHEKLEQKVNDLSARFDHFERNQFLQRERSQNIGNIELPPPYQYVMQPHVLNSINLR